jgi:hypothetical protein
VIRTDPRIFGGNRVNRTSEPMDDTDVTPIRKLLSQTIGLVSATLLLAACYPRPHEYTRVPAVSGVLLNAGNPIGGATVFVAQNAAIHDKYCQGLRSVATTDSNGNFQIAPRIEYRLVASVLNPPRFIGQMTSVCFKTSEQQYYGMSIIAPTDHQTSYRASCDLTSTRAVFLGGVSIPGNPRGICMNADRPFP